MNTIRKHRCQKLETSNEHGQSTLTGIPFVKKAAEIKTNPRIEKTPETENIVRISADIPGVKTKENSRQVEKTVVISVLIFGVTILINGIFPIISSMSIPRVAITKRRIPKKMLGGSIPTKVKHTPDKRKL